MEKLPNFDSITNHLVTEDDSQSKEIFKELVNSDGDSYMGPSDDAIISGVEEMLLNVEQEQPLNLPSNETSQALEVYEDDFLKQKQDNEDNNDTDDESGIPFDTRPLRKLKFPLPESYEHKDLAEFIGVRLINLGYCVVDNAFSEEDIDGLVSEIKLLDSKDELRTGQLGGGVTSGENDKKNTETKVRSDKMKWIQGNEEELPYAGKVVMVMDSIIRFLSAYLKVKGYGNIEGRSKAMLTCYPGNGTFYRRHVDNPHKDGRRITCILYLNKDWDVQNDGGLLRILPRNQDKQVDIPPKANRLLYFWSDHRNPHEVQPTYRERFAMTVWYFDSEERTASKVQKMEEETKSINEKISLLEEKRKEVLEATRQQQLENAAMEAVRAMSEGEKEAIGFMLSHHPQPRQLLASMGILEHVQDAVIKHLTNLE